MQEREPPGWGWRAGCKSLDSRGRGPSGVVTTIALDLAAFDVWLRSGLWIGCLSVRRRFRS